MGVPTVIVTEFVTLDGVTEAPGGEPTHPFTGWVSDYFEDAYGEFKHQEIIDADAHLLGRVTYETSSKRRTGDESSADVLRNRRQNGVQCVRMQG